jgi:hypothetical protein
MLYEIDQSLHDALWIDRPFSLVFLHMYSLFITPMQYTGKSNSPMVFIHTPCSLGSKVMTESTVRGFVVREKQCPLAEKVRLISQANRA